MTPKRFWTTNAKQIVQLQFNFTTAKQIIQLQFLFHNCKNACRNNRKNAQLQCLFTTAEQNVQLQIKMHNCKKKVQLLRDIPCGAVLLLLFSLAFITKASPTFQSLAKELKYLMIRL